LDAALLEATAALFLVDEDVLFVPVIRLPALVWLVLEEAAA